MRIGPADREQSERGACHRDAVTSPRHFRLGLAPIALPGLLVGVVSEVDPERSGAMPIPNVHAVQRTAAVAATLVATAVLFIAGLANRKISSVVGVTLGQGVLVVSIFLSAVALAYLAFHRYGLASRQYRFFDYLEGFTLSWGVAYLIEASNGVHSFFWIFHGVQVFATALAGYAPLYLATVCVGPAYLVAVFLWQGDVGSAWFSALGGILGFFVYYNVARLSSDRDAALRREAALRQELARIMVSRERARISQDLHDNVATELTALVWKVREISDTVPSGPHTSDIVSVAERLRTVIGELRNVVLALRDPELGFEELELVIARRCRELCGHTELALNIEGRVEAEELSAFRDQLLPICFELVSNAARHAGARHIELALRIGDRLRLLVSDDGSGLPEGAWLDSRGGLLGVRRRVQRLGGSVVVESAVGTRLLVDLPRPLPQIAPEL